jgi:molybdopterin/thiamine biosynthesis adenylyltransferase
MNFTDDQLKRYNRHIQLKEFGLAGQEKIANARVLVIGSGGLGSPAILYLAAAGIGTLGIADGDVIDLSNLQRQIIHSTPDLNRSKAQSAKRRIQALNPEVEVLLSEAYVTASTILETIADYDFVVDGTDNYSSKFLINDACVIAGKPFVHAGILAFQGQLITVVPHETPCYRCVFTEPPPPGTVPSCNQVGVLGTVPGVLGTMQAAECIKFLLGIGTLATGKLIVYDALHNTFNSIMIKKNPHCPVCGENPTITKPIDYYISPMKP